MQPAPRELRYDGIHCHLVIERLPNSVVLMKITGTDVGEFGDAPMIALNGWMSTAAPVDFFVDAGDVRGASIDVSGDWATWMGAHRGALKSVTMLTGSRFIRVTAEFVRRFASLEGIMRICTEPAVFERALEDAVRAQ